jgi:hypothetical protein
MIHIASILLLVFNAGAVRYEMNEARGKSGWIKSSTLALENRGRERERQLLLSEKVYKRFGGSVQDDEGMLRFVNSHDEPRPGVTRHVMAGPLSWHQDRAILVVPPSPKSHQTKSTALAGAKSRERHRQKLRHYQQSCYMAQFRPSELLFPGQQFNQDLKGGTRILRVISRGRPCHRQN